MKTVRVNFRGSVEIPERDYGGDPEKLVDNALYYGDKHQYFYSFWHSIDPAVTYDDGEPDG